MDMVFVTMDGDNVGRRVGQSVLHNDPDGLARISQGIERGQEVLRSWALSHSGRVLESGGDESTLQMPPSALTELTAVRKLYETATGATLSVGVGRELAQAAKALLAAKLRGKDRVVLYDDKVEQEVSAVKDKSEEEKIKDEYLSKDEGSGGSAIGTARVAHPAPPSRQHGEHSEGEVARNAAKVPATAIAQQDFEQSFRESADAQDKKDRAVAMQHSGDMDKLREQVTNALSGIKEQLPVLNQLKSAYPDAYQSVLGLVQGVIALGRELQRSDADLAKAIGTDYWQLGGFLLKGQDMAEVGGHSDIADFAGMGKAEECPKCGQELTPDDEELKCEGCGYVHKEETEPSEKPLPPEGVLDKGTLPPHMTTHRELELPVGTQHNGEMLVQHGDGKKSWKGLRAGQIQAQDSDSPLFGANSHPTSSREPGAK